MIDRPISYANDEILLMMNERTEENVIREPLHKARTLWKMAEGRFAFVCSSEEFILRAKKEKYHSKHWTRCKIAWRTFKNEGGRQESWSYFSRWAEYIRQFIVSIRTKDGTEYQPTSLRSLTACFEWHLKKKGYSAGSIINYLVFEKTRKVLQSKRKQVKKQGKGNR